MIEGAGGVSQGGGEGVIKGQGGDLPRQVRRHARIDIPVAPDDRA